VRVRFLSGGLSHTSNSSADSGTLFVSSAVSRGPSDPALHAHYAHAADQGARPSLSSPVRMPKMKTHSGAKKRFKLTAKGKVRARHAFSSHILEKKSPKRKRSFRKPRELEGSDAKRVKKLLGEGS
jgi:large subunit ribosomal protein L35